MKLETQLICLQERLQDAVNVCNESPKLEDQGYPYATGYSRSAMKGVIEDLNRIMQQLSDSQEIDF